jgi:hypothetical protein
MILSFEDFVREYNVDHIDLMKINIEGGEYELLEHMIEKDLIGMVDQFIIQFHNKDLGLNIYKAKERRDEIRKALSKTHKEVWCEPFIWEKWVKK